MATTLVSPPLSYADWDDFTCFNGKLSVEALRESFVIEHNFDIQDSQYFRRSYAPIGAFLHGLRDSNDLSDFGIREACVGHVHNLIAEFVKFETGDAGDPIKYTVRPPNATPFIIPLLNPDGRTSTYEVFDWPSALGYIFMAAIPPAGTANILHNYYIPLQVVYAEVLNRSFLFDERFVETKKSKRGLVVMTSLLIGAQPSRTTESLRTFGTIILGGTVEKTQSKDKTVRSSIRLLRQQALCLLLDPGRQPLFGVEALETALSELYQGCQNVMSKKLNLAAIQSLDPRLVPRAGQLLDDLSRVLGECGNRMRVLLKAISDPKDFDLTLPRSGIELLKSTSPHFFEFCLAICKDLGDRMLLDEQKTTTLSAVMKTWLNGSDTSLQKALVSAHEKAVAKLRKSDERYLNIGHCAETTGFIHFSQTKEKVNLQGVAMAPGGVVNEDNVNILWLQQQRPKTPPFQAVKRLFNCPCDDCKQIVSSRGQRYQGNDKKGYNAHLWDFPHIGRLISLWSDEDLSDFPGMDRSDIPGSPSADTSEGKGPADPSKGKGSADPSKGKGPADPSKVSAPAVTLPIRPSEEQPRQAGSSKK